MLVATIALAQALFGFSLLIPRGGDLTGKAFPTPFDWHLTIGTLVLGPGELLILIVAPLCALAVTVFLRRSPLGRASRATAENPEAARLAGVPTGRVSFGIWVIAGLLAGVGAMLIGATRPLTLSVALGPALLLRALGAAMLGGLSSIWGSFVGGVAIGICRGPRAVELPRRRRARAGPRHRDPAQHAAQAGPRPQPSDPRGRRLDADHCGPPAHAGRVAPAPRAGRPSRRAGHRDRARRARPVRRQAVAAGDPHDDRPRSPWSPCRSSC